jgi:toxin YhaV
MTGRPAPLAVNGWTLFAHPLFLTQLEDLTARVTALRQRDPQGYLTKNDTKRLAAIRCLILDVIPANPESPEFRQGTTLGEANRHWRRAKFFQQYRLFFRYDSTARVIVYAWVNDEGTKSAFDSRTDAYRVFARMLASGNPPGDWATLLRAATVKPDPAP